MLQNLRLRFGGKHFLSVEVDGYVVGDVLHAREIELYDEDSFDNDDDDDESEDEGDDDDDSAENPSFGFLT